ncbi:MAG TPA: NAD(+)/NADH kinase [Acidimicrobiales bacterium]|nr:NAD(+)/NADH kinase [Acidimicrobiales bacterium]
MTDNREARDLREIALVVHPRRLVARELADIVESWWQERGIVVHTVIALDGPVQELFQPDIAFAISLGGDGTMLRTVALASPSGIPVLGVNLGNLGYLTTVEPDEIVQACSILASGNYDIEDRMLLEVSITSRETGGKIVSNVVSMNEVVVQKTSDGHTIHLAVKIGDDQFLTYAADGMLVATPTGSTAYNLSLRGPIVSPRLAALVMTPIAPHMLFDRTLIIEPELRISFELLPDREAVAVVDGERIAKLLPGDRVEVEVSPHVARMIKIGDHGFYKILHTKFGLLDR